MPWETRIHSSLPHNGGAHVRAREPGPPTRVLCALGWEGAERALGPRAATEPGCGAEPTLVMRLTREL